MAKQLLGKEVVAALNERIIAKAEALKESDYTSESWASMQTELQEAKEELAAKHSQATVDEATSHLNAAIEALVIVETSEYKYVYAGLSWAEYWASEGVYLADGSNLTSSSDVTDKKGELDKGAFDTVSRATTNHGLHRGSYQCTAVIYDTDGKEYPVSYWNSASEAVLTDGSVITFSKGTITYNENGTEKTATMKDYEVKGIKYVPVKVKTADYAEFCKQYQVVENAGTLAGGFTEKNLQAYTETAEVTDKTNGLKEATKNADGSFSFGARATGSESGLKDNALKVAEGIEPEVKTANGSYGEFLRVDLNGNYGGLGAGMYATRWTYYGNDSTYTTCAYNTKTDKSSKIIMGMSAKSIIAGDGLYYKYVADGKTTLYRWDLNDKNKKESFNLGEFNLYMGGGFNEAGDRVFFTRFVPENGQENTELWEMSRSSGEMNKIATWYNANAEAAAQEP